MEGVPLLIGKARWVRMKVSSRVLVLAVAATSFSGVALVFLPAPFLFVGTAWCLVFMYGFIAGTAGPPTKILCWNVALCVGVCTVFEGYLWRDRARYAGDYTTYYFRDDDVLGYGPKKGVSATAARYYGDDLVYSVRYTINDQGLRITPPWTGGGDGPCVLFFGCSFPFGEGVEDAASMPYQVGLMTHGAYRVYNFGFHGYGPHHMLAALESGIVSRIVECKGPTFAIYQFIFGHIQRAAGLAIWDNSGPRYVLGPDGPVRYAGRNSDVNRWRQILQNQLHKSELYVRLVRGDGTYRDVREADVTLFIGIVRAAREAVGRLYPGSTFEVIVWDQPFADPERRHLRRAIRDLKQSGIRVHPWSDILPEFATNPARYYLDRRDGHPNATAHKLIAEYVTEKILRSRSATGAAERGRPDLGERQSKDLFVRESEGGKGTRR